MVRRRRGKRGGGGGTEGAGSAREAVKAINLRVLRTVKIRDTACVYYRGAFHHHFYSSK